MEKQAIIDDMIRHGVCDEYAELARRAESVTDLVSLYKRGANWCLSEGVPSLDAIRAAAKADGIERYGVYVDREFHGEVLWDHGVYIFHHCTGTIATGLNVRRRIMPILYFANGSDMRVVSGNTGDRLAIPARVPYFTYDTSRTEAEQSDRLQCVKMASK